jgi:hypothetical protein
MDGQNVDQTSPGGRSICAVVRLKTAGEYAKVLRERLNRSAVSIRAVLSAALAVCLIPIGTAQAGLFGPQYRSWEGYDDAPFSPYDRSWGTGDYEPFNKSATARIRSMNRGRRLNPNANARPKAMNRNRRLNPKRLQRVRSRSSSPSQISESQSTTMAH